MKAVVLTKFGPPEGLQLQEVAKPTPKDNQILVRIHATTVFAGDYELRSLKLPLAYRIPFQLYFRLARPKNFIMGQELAGEIEEVGKAVTRFKQGDQVFAWSGFGMGGYAEYTCLPETGSLGMKPAGLSYEEAAPLGVGGLEATYFLRQSNIQSGQKVLIVGAGGSIGSFAVQIAKYFGAEVTGVDSTGKLEMLRSIGADHVIDFNVDDFTRAGENSYDVIFDVPGKTRFSRTIKLLTANGRYLMGNPPLSHRIRSRGAAKDGGRQVIPWVARTASQYADDARFLTALMEARKVKTIIDKRFPLEQIAEAHRYVATGQKKGNVVITV